MILLAVILTFFVVSTTTFAVCEYYNRRIISAMNGQLLLRRKPTWKSVHKEEYRIPAQKTARKEQRFVTPSAKTMQNTQYIDA